MDLERSRTPKPSFLCRKVGFLKMANSKVLQNMHDSLNFHVFASINITPNQNWKRKTLSKTKQMLYESKKHRHSGNLFPRIENRRFSSARPYRRGHFRLFYCIFHWFGTFKDAKTFCLLQDSSILDVQGRQKLSFIAWIIEFGRSRTHKGAKVM